MGVSVVPRSTFNLESQPRQGNPRPIGSLCESSPSHPLGLRLWRWFQPLPPRPSVLGGLHQSSVSQIPPRTIHPGPLPLCGKTWTRNQATLLTNGGVQATRSAILRSGRWYGPDTHGHACSLLNPLPFGTDTVSNITSRFTGDRAAVLNHLLILPPASLCALCTNFILRNYRFPPLRTRPR